MASPRDPGSWAALQRIYELGERCALAHIDSWKRRYASNGIELPAKEFDPDRTARDGHAQAARCATPQPEQ